MQRNLEPLVVVGGQIRGAARVESSVAEAGSGERWPAGRGVFRPRHAWQCAQNGRLRSCLAHLDASGQLDPQKLHPQRRWARVLLQSRPRHCGRSCWRR